MSALLNLFHKTRNQREAINSMCTIEVLEVEKNSVGCGDIQLTYYSPYVKHTPDNSAAFVQFDPIKGQIVCFVNNGLDDDTVKHIIYNVRDQMHNKQLHIPEYCLTDTKKKLLEHIYIDGHAKKTTHITPHGIVIDYCVV
jgi:hypothetical protein